MNEMNQDKIEHAILTMEGFRVNGARVFPDSSVRKIKKAKDEGRDALASSVYSELTRSELNGDPLNQLLKEWEQALGVELNIDTITKSPAHHQSAWITNLENVGYRDP